MPATSPRDRVLYWLESAPVDTPPWDDLHDLIREYDALQDQMIGALKRGGGRVD